MSNQVAHGYDEHGNDVLNEDDTCTAADIEEAVKAFLIGDITLAQLAGLSAEDIYAVADMGYDLFEAGKTDEARKIFEGLNTYNPMDSYFHSVLGSIYQRDQRYADAARHYKSAVELFPEDLSSWTNLGETMLRWSGAQSAAGEMETAGQTFEGAVEALSKALQLTPEDDRGSALRARALVAAAASIYEARRAS